MTPRPSTYEAASSRPITHEDGARLLAFEEFVAKELAITIAWPTDASKRAAWIGQTKAFVMSSIADMGRRGYLFDGKQLAGMVRETLADIRKRQDAGMISDLFPYLAKAWKTYTGTRAEELHARSMRLGCHIDRILAKAAPRELSICELANIDQRERASVASLAEAKSNARAHRNDGPELAFDFVKNRKKQRGANEPL